MIFMCGGIPVATVIIFGVVYFGTRGINDSNNLRFWKIRILENRLERHDDIILRNLHELKIKDARYRLSRALKTLFPSLDIVELSEGISL